MDDIVFEDPPEPDKPVTPVMSALMKRPNDWALVATVPVDGVPDFWNELISHGEFDYQIVPNPDDETQRFVYARYLPTGAVRAADRA